MRSSWRRNISPIPFILAAVFVPAIFVRADDTRPIPPEFTDKSIFLTAIKNATGTPLANVSGITVPHHLLAIDLIAHTFLLASRGSYDRVIIVSPDHYNLGNADISVASRNLSTVFGELETDAGLVGALMKLPFVSTADFFYREHGIEAELPFVKYFFPQVRVVVVAVKEDTPEDEIISFTNLLEQNIGKKTLIVQSTDFSHYLPASVADKKDRQTIVTLRSGDSDKLFSLNQPDNLDSIGAQYIQMRLQKDAFGAVPKIVAHKNSQDYTKAHLASTTSYITQVYIPNSSTTMILAVGDVMLGRLIETFMNRYGAEYPFKKISATLNSADAVIGNLEGTITSDHVQTATSSLKFSFSTVVSGLLAKNNFTVLSLANNHSYDFGRKGFLETQKYLRSYSIAPLGHPYAASDSYVSTTSINGKVFAFVGFNVTNPYFPEHGALDLLRETKQKNPDALLIIFAHWGDEYSLKENTAQQSLAHKFIDAGADLVLGAHPHVVEGIEAYKKKLIFYSLGNFIFDQFFSRDTQEGLTVGLQYQDAAVSYQLIPLNIIRGQPSIMAPEKASEWLTNLAFRSDPQLKAEIQKGEITAQ